MYDSLSLNGENVIAWKYKGLSLRKLNKEQEADKCLKKALELNSDIGRDYD